ncbi:MAG TPA: hypothetical protein VMR98_01125, partial [Candidatus Polarisedimenticolaceae bacterium]|nr:hypothetical protein [Candidatus Polarisedimenticolaceae bacterium]
MNEERAKDEQQAASAAATSGIPYSDTRDTAIPSSLPEGVTRELLEEYLGAPLHIYNPQSLELGLTGQTDRGKLPALQAKVPGV